MIQVPTFMMDAGSLLYAFRITRGATSNRFRSRTSSTGPKMMQSRLARTADFDRTLYFSFLNRSARAPTM